MKEREVLEYMVYMEMGQLVSEAPMGEGVRKI